MGSDNQQESTQASRELLEYVRKILGPSSFSSSAAGPPKVKLPIAQSGGTGREAPTNGERPSGSPRQLQAEAITRPSRSSSGSSASFSLGNNWLISPVAGVLNSILDLFGVGSSTSQVTRYRAETRQPFQIVEEISPESGAKVQTINESASGLFGVTGGNSPTEAPAASAEETASRSESITPSIASGGTRRAEGSTIQQWLQSLVGGSSATEAPAVSAEEIAGKPESTTPSIPRAESGAGSVGQPANTTWARRVSRSTGLLTPRGGAVESRTKRAEATTNERLLQKEMGSAGSTGTTMLHAATWTNGITAPTGSEGRSLMNDRQGLIAAVRRSLNDSRGFSDVLSEFQDGL